MKLTDLEPRWIGPGNSLPSEFAQPRWGISFLCPCCKSQRIGVMFKPAIDPDNNAWRVLWAHPEVKEWDRTGGDTFEDLTLSPSINLEQHGHWHGFITNGQIQ